MSQSGIHSGTGEEARAGAGTSDPRWQGALDQLRAHPVHGSDFEILRTGPVTSC